MEKYPGLSGPHADAARAKLRELISQGAAGAKAKAAANLPGNQYVSYSEWTGTSSGGTIASEAIVVPTGATVSILSAAMIVAPVSGSGGGGGGFLALLPQGNGAIVTGTGVGSGEFVAMIVGSVMVNGDFSRLRFHNRLQGLTCQRSPGDIIDRLSFFSTY